MDNSILRVCKLTPFAYIPSKGSKVAAGYDLKSAYDAIVPAHGSTLIKTDLSIHLREGTYGRIAPRSGLALKHQIDVGGGVIDADYRGNVRILLFNHFDQDLIIHAGDRVAQLICEKIAYPEMVEVKSLNATKRGDAGFGSTDEK